MPTGPTHQLGTAVTAAEAVQAQLLLDRCHDLIGERNYQGAAAAQKAIELVPNLPDPYIALAEAMVGMGAHERAVDAYTGAYRRAQRDKQFEILKSRAYNKHRVGDYVSSINDLSEMIVLQPENAQCYTRRGITRGEIGDYKGAIDDFEKAGAISGLGANLHNLLAHANMHAALAPLEDEPGSARQSAEKAFRHFDSALDADPLHQQANEGVQVLRAHLGCFGIVR